VKILLLSTYEEKGGAAIACKRLLKALNKQEDVEAKMLVLQKQSEDPDVKQAQEGGFGQMSDLWNVAYERLSFLPYERAPSVRFQFSIANTGQNITSHYLYKWCDVVNVHWINQGFLSIKTIGKLMHGVKPMVWTLHDMWAFTGGEHYAGNNRSFENESGFSELVNRPAKKDLSHRLWKRKKNLYSASPYIATCSAWLKKEAESSSLLSSATIRNIPNPIDLQKFVPGDRMALREKLGLPKDKRLILFGAFNLKDERKGMAYLFDALGKRGSNEQDCLVLFGKGDVPDLGIQQHKMGVVKASDMAKLYSACDVFVSPSVQDNLPNTIMEAMACGCPCLAFDVGGIPEMIDHKKNGYLAKFGDASDLAFGLDFILEHPDLASECRPKVESEYTEDIVASRYLEYYREIQSQWKG
jgi:glycosyltransferase involved in cell wall biosynthesis